MIADVCSRKVTKRRVQDPSAEEQHDRGRTESKSLERKRKRKQVQPPQQYHHRHRSVSSSSTSSSPSSHSSDRGFDHRHSKGRGNRPKTGEDQTSRQQLRHKKRSKSPNEIRKEGRSAKKKRDASAESWNRSKDRKGTGKGESPQRQQRGAGAGGSGMDRGRQRNRQIQHGLKASRNISQPSGRRVGNRKDRAESPHFSKDRQRRGADSSVDRAEKDGREREKRERNVRKDDSRDRAGPTSKVRDRLEEQGRSGRMASGGGGAFAQQAERGGRLITRRGNSADRDSRRNFGGSEISGRMGQFPRPDLDRGQMGGRMGHIWDEGRREGPGDWETGPERRAFGGPRDDSTGSGKRRDGGREERLLPHPARGGPVRSGSQDRLLSRGGHGQRDEFNNGQDRVRDRRGTLQEGDGNKRERDNNRGGREENRAGRGRDDSIKCRPAERDDNFNKDREVRDRNKGVSGNRSASGVSLLPGRGEESGNRVVSKLKSELIKEDSPSAMRGESSLAAVFDQTETTRASNVLTTSSTKRRTTKSFGGKKSPKKTSADDSKTLEEKGRLRLGGRAERLVAADKKKSALSDTERGAKKITPSRDNQKGDGRTMAKHETASKERTSPGSQRSADSHHSRSRSSRKSSQSPDNRREVATTQDCLSSLQSPATASYEQQSRKSKEKDNKNAAALGRGRRRGAGDKVKTSEAGDHRGRSESLSDAESKNSPGLQERRRRKSSDSIESLPAKLDGGDIAAAMLGDGAEDGQQDVFSDWSDDDDTFNTIIDDDPRKHHVEDLDDNHDFSYGSRGHSHDLRGRRTSPATADPAPGMLLHGSGLMEAGMGHHDGHGAGLGREGYPHQLHYSSAAGQYFGNEMIMGGSHGDGSHNGQLLSSRIDQESRAQVDDLLAKPALEKNIPGVKIVEDIQKEKPARERRRRDTGEEGYEEISSDENDLDEEGEKIPKRTIVSILDIDMSSLAQITKPSRPLSPSVSGRPAVFQRYKACSVFSQLGLSRQLAGEALFEQVQAVCQKQLEQQESLMEKDTIKQGDGEAAIEKTKPSVGIGMKSAMATISSTQPSSFSSISSPSSSLPANAQSFAPAYNLDDSIASSTKNLDIKEETENLESSDNTLTVSSKNASPKPITPESEHPQFEPVAKVEPVTARKLLMPDKKVKKPEFKLYGDAPSDHILQKARAQKRAALLGNFGLFRRALTARKDLSIRRQLCKIDSNYDQSAIYPSGLADPDMFRASLQLLKQKTACMMTTK
ncbi:Zinc finger ccch domain-containing protein 13 [Plakobranchus ocellatus]|uniref:Zinc finger ccch domain-containing protein 13 n=1 Tax=Plakobranchus ocellatus TaxID=259542 RepID=A0AAV3Y835_9GAST|nr:Zinc finger ccch domain-containing protein 13 [Plakobranchus ocellatus]